MKKKTPSEELPNRSRTHTCPLKSVSPASTFLDSRKMNLPLGWLLLCSWIITISLAFISCSEFRMEFALLFGLFLQALARSKLVLFLVIFQQMGTNFAAICLKSLVHHVLYQFLLIMCHAFDILLQNWEYSTVLRMLGYVCRSIIFCMILQFITVT